jgi:hypothetical protein
MRVGRGIRAEPQATQLVSDSGLASVREIGCGRVFISLTKMGYICYFYAC